MTVASWRRRRDRRAELRLDGLDGRSGRHRGRRRLAGVRGRVPDAQLTFGLREVLGTQTRDVASPHRAADADARAAGSDQPRVTERLSGPGVLNGRLAAALPGPRFLLHAGQHGGASRLVASRTVVRA